MRIAPIKTAAQAATNYGTNGGSPTAANNWATNFSADIPAILAAASAAGPTWQANVATAAALTAFQNGLNRAKNNISAIQTKVAGVGKASFTAGVKAAATGNYQVFATSWMPKVATEVSTLRAQNPGTDPASGTARMIAYNAWAISQHGLNRVK